MIDQTATLVGSKEINAPAGRPAHRSLPNRDEREQLEQRFGRLHSRQRLGIEDDHEARARGSAPHPLRPRRWYLSPVLVRRTLKITGLYWWAHKNSQRIEIRRNPDTFAGAAGRVRWLHDPADQRPACRHQPGGDAAA